MVLAIILTLTVLLLASSNGQVSNERPIIGILAQPSDPDLLQYGPQFIAASYVKWVEGGGARVVPIRYTLPPNELQELFSSINGIVLPGGGVDFSNQSTDYVVTLKSLYQLAISANANGDFFPVWGTCMGFQELCMLQSANFSLLTGFNSENYTVPLDFTSFAPESRLYGAAPSDVYTAFATEPITMNNHQYGVSPSSFAESPALVEFFDILSTNVDRDGKEFISGVESKKYPIYAVQYHPEKPLYEWNIQEVINHSSDSVLANQFTSTFFIDQCRGSGHQFASAEAEANALIYNYPPVYIFPIESSFELGYFIPN